MKSLIDLTLPTLLVISLFLTSCGDSPFSVAEDNMKLKSDLSTLVKTESDHSTLGSVGAPIETIFSATLVHFEPKSQTVLPSGTVINEFATLWEMTGDWEGTLVGDNSQTIHKNGVATGKASFNFEGTVLGFEGTLEIRFKGLTKADGTFTGRSTILRGTGELANLRGHGTNGAVVPGEIEGTFLVHFAP